MQCAVRSKIARNNVKERREEQVKEERARLENKSAVKLQGLFRWKLAQMQIIEKQKKK